MSWDFGQIVDCDGLVFIEGCTVQEGRKPYRIGKLFKVHYDFLPPKGNGLPESASVKWRGGKQKSQVQLKNIKRIG